MLEARARPWHAGVAEGHASPSGDLVDVERHARAPFLARRTCREAQNRAYPPPSLGGTKGGSREGKEGGGEGQEVWDRASTARTARAPSFPAIGVELQKILPQLCGRALQRDRQNAAVKEDCEK